MTNDRALTSNLAALHQATRRTLEKLLFLNEARNRPLEIPGPPEPVRFLRLQLAARECFHLERVKLLTRTPHGLVDIAAQARLTLSSIWPGTEGLVERRAILTGQRGSRPFGFHTELEAKPWIMLSLPEPVPIARLVISNRADDRAYRALSLLVLASPDATRWTLLHNHPALLKAAQQRIEARFHGHAHEPALRLALKLMWWWYLGHVRGVQTAWNSYAAQPEKTPAQQQAVRFFNHEILAPQQLELTPHGPKRTFRFWSETEKTAYLAFANDVMAALRPLSPHACLGFGTALGIIRDGDLIPHDDDIDILLALPRARSPSFAHALRAIHETLTPQGFTTAGRFKSHRWISRFPHKLDVFPGIIENDHVSFHPGPRKLLRMNNIFPAAMARLHGTAIPLPRDPPAYLAKIYGADWNIPNATWRHKWRAEGFEDLLS